MQNHYSITPIKAFVIDDFLMKDEFNLVNLVECKIIGVCLYENETICFDVILKDGSIFNYVPLHKVVHKEDYDKKIQLKDLVYHNSKSIDITINYMEALNEIKLAYLKHQNSWVCVEEYILTIDWYKDNDLLNFIKLKNGFFAFLPNHKLKTNNEKNFKAYKKIPDTYIV